jgi:hypothetical protein
MRRAITRCLKRSYASKRKLAPCKNGFDPRRLHDPRVAWICLRSFPNEIWHLPFVQPVRKRARPFSKLEHNNEKCIYYALMLESIRGGKPVIRHLSRIPFVHDGEGNADEIPILHLHGTIVSVGKFHGIEMKFHFAQRGEDPRD